MMFGSGNDKYREKAQRGKISVDRLEIDISSIFNNSI